ncbi:hypothetical protein ACO0SA_002245 [Hanseniaspora valbyensis]
MEYIHKPYIFVGAGLATLACVNNLIESDEKDISKNDILILEAMDYKGGRMKTHQPENLEIGASWLHDSLDNKVLDYMVEKDLITFEKTHFDDIHKSKKVVGYFDDNVKLLLYNGQSYTNNSKFRLEILLDEFEKYVENYFFQEENLQTDPSLKWIFLKYINERKHFFKANHSKKQLELLSLFVRYVETWHGISWENLSAKYAFMHSMGQNILCFGFYKFINYLSEGITINYNENVSSIIKRKNHYIINDKYVTENCVISVPQSCFNDIKFNDSLINQELKESYDKLHYGSLGKIIIELDKDFDLENTRLYHMGQIKPNDSVLIEKAMSYDDMESITTKSLIEDYNTDECNVTLENFCDWPMLIVNHQSIISKPILLILTQEPVTSLLEKSFSKSPNDIIPFLKPLIENIGKFLYKDPQHECQIKKVLISNWSQNKYQKGSYPACHPNDDPLDVTIQTTLQNECSKLKIIGEYTNLEGCGSLNGAWLSGIECADTIKNQN